MKIISPNSHIWKELTHPRKGTVCDNCGTGDNLMAYRSPYNKQTVCKSCLNKAKEQ